MMVKPVIVHYSSCLRSNGRNTFSIFSDQESVCIDRRQLTVSAELANLFVMPTVCGTLRRSLSMLFILAVLPASQATEHRVFVGNFSQGDLSTWTPQPFKGKTDYRLVDIGDRRVLKATSDGSASGLSKRVHIDLTCTPILGWSWRVEGVFQGIDERSKGGDDYAARLYVIVSGGLLFWRTRSLNYVWSSYQPLSSAWPNPYTAKVMMVAVASGSDSGGKWVAEKRDVRADFRRYFGQDVTAIDGVAVMTDTDDTSRHAVAYYGDIYFEPAAGRSSRQWLHGD